MVEVKIEKYDVCGDGKPNTSTIRTEKFVFEHKKDAILFTDSVIKALGILKAKLISYEKG